MIRKSEVNGSNKPRYIEKAYDLYWNYWLKKI